LFDICFFQIQRENPPLQYQQPDEQQIELLINEYDIFRVVLKYMKSEFDMRDEEYNYRFLRDIIIDRFKRTGMWTYDRIDTMILDVKESITPQISKSHSCTEYTGMICPVTATQVSLTSGGEYTDIGGVKIVNSAVQKMITTKAATKTTILSTNKTERQDNTITSQWTNHTSRYMTNDIINCYLY